MSRNRITFAILLLLSLAVLARAAARPLARRRLPCPPA